MSYSLEARISKHPERVGKGDIKCVAGPGSADNSAAGGALVPLLSLSIPGSETTAVLLGALMIHGMRPGPMLFSQHSQLVWATIASLYIANTLGLILASAGIRPLTQILKLPTPIMCGFSLNRFRRIGVMAKGVMSFFNTPTLQYSITPPVTLQEPSSSAELPFY